MFDHFMIRNFTLLPMMFSFNRVVMLSILLTFILVSEAGHNLNHNVNHTVKENSHHHNHNKSQPSIPSNNNIVFQSKDDWLFWAFSLSGIFATSIVIVAVLCRPH